MSNIKPEEMDEVIKDLLLLEMNEGPTPEIEIKDNTIPINNQAKTTKSSRPVINPDVHETSMEIVQTVRWGGAIE